MATARAEGRADGPAAAPQLAAAESEYAAAGKITDPDNALEMLDLDKLKDGAPDLRKIRALVDQLAGAPAAAAALYVPAPLQTQPNRTR